MQELFLLHQALSPEFLSNQNLLRNGVSSIQLVIIFINYNQINAQSVTIFINILCKFSLISFTGA